MASRQRSFHYAWVVAILTFLTLLAVAGVRSASGVLFIPLEHDMGWSAATISIAVAINVTLYGALGPFAAACMEAVGIRATMLFALALIALSTAAASAINSPLELALTWGLGLGIGTGAISMVLVAVVSTRWFVTRRGLVYGALTGATATGQLLFLPLLAWIAQTYGWRPVGLVCGAVALVIAIPVALFMRDRPESLGLRPYGAPATASLDRGRHGTNPLKNTFAVLGRASRSRDFWLVGGTFFVCGATTNGFIGTHFMAMCGDVGIPQLRSASYIALVGVFSLIGSTASGWLSDRYASRFLLFTYYGLRGLSLFVLPYALVGANSDYALPVFIVFYGLDWLATGAPNVRALTQALGKEDTPIAFGWIGVFHQVGAGIAAAGAGLIRTSTGSYADSFTVAGALCLIAALAALGIGVSRRAPSEPPADRRREPASRPVPV